MARLEIERTTKLTAAKLREAAAMLAAAFDDGPLFRFALPHAASRSKVLRRLFAVILKDAVRFGRVEIAYNRKIVGIFIWYPPGGYPISLARMLRFLPECAGIAAASPAGVARLFRAQTKLNRLHPRQPHYHASFLAGRQGEPVGNVLAGILRKEADEKGLPVYLETQERRSVEWYCRLGFKILHEGTRDPAGRPADLDDVARAADPPGRRPEALNRADGARTADSRCAPAEWSSPHAAATRRVAAILSGSSVTHLKAAFGTRRQCHRKLPATAVRG